MEVTLRKAAALSQSLLETSKALPLSKTATISVYAGTTVAEVVAATQAKLSQNADKAVSLVRAAYDIRSSISTQNAINGVSKLMTERAALDTIEKMLAGITGKAATYDEPVEVDASIAQAQFDALKERLKVSSADRYGREETLSVSLLGGETVLRIQGQLADIRRRKIAIADELLTLNMTKKVALSADTVALLREFKLV